MGAPEFERLLAARLEALRARGQLRDRDARTREAARDAASRLGVPFLDLSSNDYLGLKTHPLSTSTQPAGAGASRLIHGTGQEHRELETALAGWLEVEDCVLFSSGYAANVGLVSALAASGDHIVSDALNHASIIDGCRLGKASLAVVPHRDVAALERALHAAPERTTWVVSEAFFSMDGTQADLAGLADVLRHFPNAHLLLDEAHSLGVFGPRGRGLAASAGLRPAALVGTFGKAFGLHGAFVAGSRSLCSWLWNRARSFVFSTATSPALARTALGRLQRVIDAEEDRRHLADLADWFHVELERRFPGRRPVGSTGPIVPLVLGSEQSATAAADALVERGILVQAIRPPTVPDGTSRLRLTLTAAHQKEDLVRALDALESAVAGALPQGAPLAPACP